MTTVVIDPGHGGDKKVAGSSSNNAVGPKGTLEKTLTLKFGLKVREVLQDTGLTVLMTRTTDVNLGLASRAAVAKKVKADCFLSIHLNGSTKHNAQGTETLVHKNFSKRSADFSLSVQDELLKATGLKDRNKSFHPSRIKPQALGVLNPSRHFANTAACLVEVSFMDRENEEKRLLTNDYIDAVAQALAKGVADFVGVSVSDDVEFDDAIEAEAIGANTTTEKHLGLKPKTSSSATNPEGTENVGSPKGAFASAFLTGGFNDNALLSPVAAQEDYFAEFSEFVTALNLAHFAPDELLELGGSHHGNGACKGLNEVPPKALWPNIVPTIRLLDRIREHMGAAVRINSAYRNAAYNSCVRGVPGSFHRKFMAIDFRCRQGTPLIWFRVAKTLMENDSTLAGGIGLYNTFVHIDCRGSIVTW